MIAGGYVHLRIVEGRPRKADALAQGTRASPGPYGPISGAPVHISNVIRRHLYLIGLKSFNTFASSIIVSHWSWKYVHSELSIALVSNFQNPPMRRTQV